MVVYLNKNLFKPAVVFLSAVFSFLFLLLLILTLVTFQLTGVILLIALTVAYVTLLCLSYAAAQSRKYYLKEWNEYLEIEYPKVGFERGRVKIPYRMIARFTYYPMDSWKGWEHFLNTSVLPDCVYVSYVNKYGKMVSEPMGHVERKVVEKLAKRYGVKVEVVK